MKIISHRGYWKTANEKNMPKAFQRSFSLGYGTETDIRDCQGCLLISHDMPAGHEMPLQDVLAMASQACSAEGGLTLALNIKADGLASALQQQLALHPALDCFAFDMAVPDMRGYLAAGIPVFTRLSEAEPHPVWLDEAAGVWLDAFFSEWYSLDTVTRLLHAGKRVCLVSPELHRRPHAALWEFLRPLANEPRLMLCTDLPEDATQFFAMK